MKKTILFLMIGIFIISLLSTIYAQDCQLATPRYGVVQCVDTNQKETLQQSFSCSDGDWCSITLPCLSNCQLTGSINWGGDCPWGYTKNYEVILGSNNLGQTTNTPWSRGDNLVVRAICKMPLLGYLKPVPSGTQVIYQQDKIMLEEGWAGSLPDAPISGTEGCVLNKEFGDGNVNSYLDPQTGQTVNEPSSSYSSSSQFPSNWKIGDHLIFVKDWQTGIADISLAYDKNNKGYWCGGQYGSRKIYSVQEITSSTGQCYAVPQSISLSNVECCFPSDCVSKGAEYTCNPDDWKCEQTKPCNSQTECDQTFGAGVCQNNQINQWVCDLTKKWGNSAGTCVHSAKEVTNCPSDCNSRQYYDESEGKCLTRTGVIEQNQNTSSELSSTAYSKTSSSSAGSIILIIFVIIIIGSIGFFIYAKGKKNKSSSTTKNIPSQVKASRHCTKCGNPLKKGSKFCTKCGHKL